MIEKLKRLINKKWFHICIMIIIVTILISTATFITIKYNVEGEKNMPFNLSKITVISSSEGNNENNEIIEEKRKYRINQNNDIHLYIEKNKNFDKEAIIEKINIENIKIERESEKGTINIYKPEFDETKPLFENKEENKVENIEYIGDLESNIKNLKISNQGGIIIFRCANDNIAEYYATLEEDVNTRGLLKKVDISEEDLKFKIFFDIIIKTKNLKEYKAEVSLNLPIEGIKEKDVSSIEKIDLKDIVFKRIKN